MSDFTETNLLIAALKKEEDEGKRLIKGMLPNERAALQRAMVDIDDWISEVEELEHTATTAE